MCGWRGKGPGGRREREEAEVASDANNTPNRDAKIIRLSVSCTVSNMSPCCQLAASGKDLLEGACTTGVLKQATP